MSKAYTALVHVTECRGGMCGTSHTPAHLSLNKASGQSGRPDHTVSVNLSMEHPLSSRLHDFSSAIVAHECDSMFQVMGQQVLLLCRRSLHKPTIRSALSILLLLLLFPVYLCCCSLRHLSHSSLFPDPPSLWLHRLLQPAQEHACPLCHAPPHHELPQGARA